MQPYLCHDGRHLVTWLVRGELTGKRHATNWNSSRTHSRWATAGQPDHFKVTPELPVCTMRFLFNHSPASSSPTLPETQGGQVENKQTADDDSLKLKIGCLDFPRATELNDGFFLSPRVCFSNA